MSDIELRQIQLLRVEITKTAARPGGRASPRLGPADAQDRGSARRMRKPAASANQIA